jgi:hypothetical protein
VNDTNKKSARTPMNFPGWDISDGDYHSPDHMHHRRSKGNLWKKMLVSAGVIIFILSALIMAF